MQTVLGFLFDFKSNAGKTFKKVRQDISKTTSDFIAAIKKISKFGLARLGRDFVMARQHVKFFVDDLKKSAPKIADIISDIGETFGGVAGIVADTLLRPGAMVAGATAIAVKSGKDMERTLVGIQRETSLTTEELDKYGDSIVKISKSIHAPLTQVEALAKTFAAANVPIEEFDSLMKTTISMNRITGDETSKFAEEVYRLRNQFHMAPDDIRKFYNTLVGTAKASNSNLSQLSDAIMSNIDLASRILPQDMAKGVEEITKIQGALRDTFENAQPILQNFIKASINIDSQEYRSIRQIAFRAGDTVRAAFEDSMNKADFTGAFRSFLKGVKTMSDEEIRQMFVLQDEFGRIYQLPASAFRDLKKIDESMLDKIDMAAQLAKKQDQLYGQTVDLRTSTEKWLDVWSDIQRIALPFGTLLVEFLSVSLGLINAILQPIETFVQQIGKAGVLAVALGLAFATYSWWLKPVSDLMSIVIVKIAAASAEARLMGLAIWGWVKGLGAFLVSGNVVATIGKVILGIFTGIGTAVGIIASGIYILAGVIVELLWPVFAVMAGLTLLNKGFAKLTGGISLVQMLGKALSFVGDILGYIGSIIGGIIKGIVYIATLGEVNLFGSEAPSKPSDKSTNPTVPSLSNLEDIMRQAKQGSPTGQTDANQTSSIPEYAANPEPVDYRKGFGTDDLISATYNAAGLIVETLKRMAPVLPSAGIGGVRHQPIEAPTNIGGGR